MFKKIIFIIISILFISCGNKNKFKVDVSGIKTDVDLVRFEQEFYNSDEKKLPQLKKKYPVLFPVNQNDSVWLNKINNKDEQDLFKATSSEFKDFKPQISELEKLFKHVKYYHPKFKEPKVFTILTNMQDRIVYADTLLFISLDNYLGKNSDFYQDYPNYIKDNNTKKHLIVDVAKEFANRIMMPFHKRTLIERMIYEGKKLYLLDVYTPDSEDYIKFGCTQEKMNWAKENSANIWRYFIEKNYLYSTDRQLLARFIDLAPFSKFYLEFDSKSPGKIGAYIGWQIVRSYMKKNKVSLSNLIKEDEMKIFKKSHYKAK